MHAVMLECHVVSCPRTPVALGMAQKRDAVPKVQRRHGRGAENQNTDTKRRSGHMQDGDKRGTPLPPALHRAFMTFAKVSPRVKDALMEERL